MNGCRFRSSIFWNPFRSIKEIGMPKSRYSINLPRPGSRGRQLRKVNENRHDYFINMDNVSSDVLEGPDQVGAGNNAGGAFSASSRTAAPEKSARLSSHAG